MSMDLSLYATNFLQTPRTKHPTLEQLSPFYATLNPESISKTSQMVYSYPWGLRTLQGKLRLPGRMVKFKDEKDPERRLANNLAGVQNDTLKGDIVLSAVNGTKSFESYKQVMDSFGQYLLTDKQKKAGYGFGEEEILLCIGTCQGIGPFT